MFADDTSILCTSKNYDLKTKLDVILGHMVDWFQNNKLALNLNKTKIIKFTTTASACYPLNLVIHNKAFQEVETMKSLCPQLDNHLTCRGYRFSATQVECPLLFNEKIILYIEYKWTENCILCLLPFTSELWNNILGKWILTLNTDPGQFV
jgi:hypothetical protein